MIPDKPVRLLANGPLNFGREETAPPLAARPKGGARTYQLIS